MGKTLDGEAERRHSRNQRLQLYDLPDAYGVYYAVLYAGWFFGSNRTHVAPHAHAYQHEHTRGGNMYVWRRIAQKDTAYISLFRN